MRVVLDNNVIVAGLAYPAGPPGRIVAAWRSGALQVVLSAWILAECERVLLRLRPYTRLTLAEIQERLIAHLPEELFPDGAKAGWWAKTVQLDLKAKGIVAREKTRHSAYTRPPQTSTHLRTRVILCFA